MQIVSQCVFLSLWKHWPPLTNSNPLYRSQPITYGMSTGEFLMHFSFKCQILSSEVAVAGSSLRCSHTNVLQCVLHLVPCCSLTLALSKLRICPWKAAGLLRATGRTQKQFNQHMHRNRNASWTQNEARFHQIRRVPYKLNAGYPIRLTVSLMWETLQPT